MFLINKSLSGCLEECLEGCLSKLSELSNFLFFLLFQGANSYGQLCLGHQEDILTPENLTERQPEQIRTVTGGGGHTAVITGLSQKL